MSWQAWTLLPGPDHLSRAEKMLSTYLTKMNRKRLRPRFGYLLQTGRTFCGGGFNLQNLPRETDESAAARTIRGCFVPGENQVFIDSDYSQIELVVLAHVLKVQFNYGHNLADVINVGQDVHRLIAATVLGKAADDVSKADRNSAKPISFGRPGGMGPERLRQIAQASYGIDLTIEEVQMRIDAYHSLCPELTPFLQDEDVAGLVLASALDLTPSAYAEATGRWIDQSDANSQRPQGWLGGMLLKTLKDDSPLTRNGREYSQHELDFFRQAGQRIDVDLDPELRKRLDRGQADLKLWQTVRSSVGRRSVFTITGRLRAQASFSQRPQQRVPGTSRGRRHSRYVADLAGRLQDRQLCP